MKWVVGRSTYFWKRWLNKKISQFLRKTDLSSVRYEHEQSVEFHLVGNLKEVNFLKTVLGLAFNWIDFFRSFWVMHWSNSKLWKDWVYSFLGSMLLYMDTYLTPISLAWPEFSWQNSAKQNSGLLEQMGRDVTALVLQCLWKFHHLCASSFCEIILCTHLNYDISLHVSVSILKQFFSQSWNNFSQIRDKQEWISDDSYEPLRISVLVV